MINLSNHISMPLSSISHILLILSGKGGVGKSSITLQLALSLTLLGKNVGILDIDLTGPSIPRLLGLENRKIRQTDGGWLPVEVHPSTSSTEYDERDGSRVLGSLSAISLGFLLPSRSSAVIWRGPKKTAMIRQFLSDVAWPSLDYLLVDTPPGTSDEHIALLEELHKIASPGQLAGAVVVTTPQAVSTSDVRKELNFCLKTGIEVVGVIENMAGFICPCCGEMSDLFSNGGGEVMAKENGVNFIGRVPIDPSFGLLVDGVRDLQHGEAEEGNRAQDQRLLVERWKECKLSRIFDDFARDIIVGSQ